MLAQRPGRMQVRCFCSQRSLPERPAWVWQWFSACSIEGEADRNMFKGNNRRVQQLMLIAFVAMMAIFWLGILWFAVYRPHWL